MNFNKHLFLVLVTVMMLFAQEPVGQKPALNETVVLLHGLGRGKSIMVPLQERLEKAGYVTHLIDYRSIGRSPEEIVTDVTGQIEAVSSKGTKKLHFVGHSLGGLLVRAYLDSHRVQNLGRVVLIGSPSKGTPIVDYFRDTWLLKLAGPAATSLGTDTNSFPKTLGVPYYPVGVIAGISSTFNNDDFIPGEDDGVVPVESTKIDGMTDFISVNVSHSSLPRSEEVGRQVIEFLLRGTFLHEEKKN